MPNDFFARNDFGNFHFAVVNVWDTVRELSVEFVGVALDFSRPPSADVVDGGEGFFRGLVNRKRSAVILVHSSNLLISLASLSVFNAVFVCDLLVLVGLTHTLGNQIAQAAVYV